MAQETFGQLWNKVLLYAPGTPVLLAQQFVKNSYDKVTRAHTWSELYQEGEVTLATEYTTGTVTCTNGSSTVALATGTVTTAWENVCQLGVYRDQGYAPYYDIVSVNTTNNTMTLDRNYQGASTTNASFVVAQYFVEFPSDLYTLDDIRDLNRNWRLRRQYNQPNYLDRIDARRSYAGTPILYVPATPRVSSGVAYPRYEFWPRIPSGTRLAYRYVKKSTLSASTDRPVEALIPETLIWGALAELTLVPGSPERPNPYFSLDLHREYVKLYEEGLQASILSDQERAQRLITYAEDDRGYPADARFIQEHGLA